MELSQLKQKLLDTNLIIDNEYLEKYLTLLHDNIQTKQCSGQTQKHHVFPKCLSKILGQKIDNTTINLQYKDHILAHYYLIYATENNKLKSANIHAFNHLLKYQGHLLDEQTLKSLLTKQQIVYEQSKYLRSIHSKEINSGGCYINNGVKTKHIKLEELETYLNAGWKQGVIARSCGNTKGTITINNGQIEKRIKPELLSLFLADN